MKKLLLSLIVITTSVFLFAQTPNQFKYQAVLRNTDGTIMAEESVNIIFSILKSDLTTSVFEEIHITTTTAQGLINLNIGSIEDLSTINWTLDEYFIEIIVNGTIIGTSQLLSVPYALHAKTAETVTGEITITETDPAYTASQAVNITATDITNLGNLSGTNTGDQDISGITTNATAITSIQGEQTTQDAAIAANTEKVGVTTAQSDAIIANTGKDTTGIYHANREALDLVSGTNTGDQDISGITTNASSISTIQTEQSTQDAAISLNTAKTGITTAQSDAIIANTGKDTIGIYHANRAALDLVSGTNTGDQDITAMTHTNRAALDAVSGTNTGDEDLSSLATKINVLELDNITVFIPDADYEPATKMYVDEVINQVMNTFAKSNESFTSLTTGIVMDVDNNTYNIIKIGSQWWMEENLATTLYANGDVIPDGTGAGDISGESDPKYWFAYDDDLNNVTTYGRLYTWYTVIDSRNICPDGWHVPTDVEWTTMENYLIANGYNYDGTITGNKIAKSLASTTNWTSSATTGVVGNTDYPAYRNKTNFTALPGGYRSNDGTFDYVGYYGNWWSATELDATHAWNRNMYFNTSNVGRNDNNKKIGFSVRCVRD